MKKLLFLGLVALFALSCGDDDVSNKKKANISGQKLSITTCNGNQKDIYFPLDMVEVLTPSAEIPQFTSIDKKSVFDIKKLKLP